MKLTIMSGAGNRFAVIDAFTDALPNDMPEFARAVCARVEPRVDGLLVAARPTHGGDCAMILYNADGSRPETCGNGLRCIAKLVRDRGHVTKDAFVIETDAGPCATTVERVGGLVVRARVHMGAPKVIARDVAITIDMTTRGALAPGEMVSSNTMRETEQHATALPRNTTRGTVVRGTLVDVGNPHCVVFVDDERNAPVALHGPRIETHSMFPRGTNVEFFAVRGGRAYLRVWERGVGETRACGSGACAAAAAAVERGLARFPVRIELPGGVLEVDDDVDRGASADSTRDVTRVDTARTDTLRHDAARVDAHRIDGSRAKHTGVFLTGPVEELGVLDWDARDPATTPTARRG